VHGHWGKECPTNNLLKDNEDMNKEDVGLANA
jgi:hypothetical protein